jgi:hypothetical protein
LQLAFKISASHPRNVSIADNETLNYSNLDYINR